ncbi:MAG: hypothetical protein K2P81_07365 [Bacteriovoracaceae bacterium]|nr:hypothetical protein [Bacteriovoracaceae bacterium]
MKKLLLLALTLLSLSSFAQVDGMYISADITLSPTKITADLLRGTSAVTIAPFMVTSVTQSLEARGVAGQEQIRDELVAYDRDVTQGLVHKVSDIKQPALKELVLEILENPEMVKEIDSKIPAGTIVDKVMIALTIQLL